MPRKHAQRPAAPQGTLVGYARVSTLEQNLDMQVQALLRAGVHRDNLHVEKVSAVDAKRPRLEWAIDSLREGDVLIVWKLDRIARSMRHLFDCIDRIEAAGASFRSITESVDNSTPFGKAFIQILGMFAELERNQIVERTQAGVDAAKKRGVKFGQPAKLNKEQQAVVRDWIKVDGLTIREAARRCKTEFGVKISHTTAGVYARKARRSTKRKR